MHENQYSSDAPFDARLAQQSYVRQRGLSLFLGRLALVAAFSVVLGLIITVLIGITFWLLDLGESLVHQLRRTR